MAKKKIGRYEKPIDWAKVDELLKAGCLGVELAALFGMHKETFYRRCVKEKGVSFTDYQDEKRAEGDSLLRAVQFDEAVRKRNTTMLVWLGKNRLDQTDKKEIKHDGTCKFNVINYGEKKPVTYEDTNVIEAKVTKIDKESKDDTK